MFLTGLVFFCFSCHEVVDESTKTMLANSTTTGIVTAILLLLAVICLWLFIENRKLKNKCKQDFDLKQVSFKHTKATDNPMVADSAKIVNEESILVPKQNTV